MIQTFLLLKIFTCIVSLSLASALVSRDPGLKVTRLLAMIPVCTAFWSFCEILWSLETDPEQAVRFVRASSLGWMMIGAFCLHTFIEIVDAPGRAMRLLLPVAYILGLSSVMIYNFTSLGLVNAFLTDWGWSYHFGPLFLVLYCAALWPLSLVVGSWGWVLPRGGSRGERRVWLSIYVAVVLALTIATLTDALLPLLGISVIPLGSTTLVFVGTGIAYQFHRYGYSLLAPGAFASEILDTLGDGVVLLRGDGRIHSTNAAFEKLTSMRSGELRGLELSRLVNELPRDPARIADGLELDLVTPAGARIPVLVLPAPMEAGQRSARGGALVIRDLREVRALRDRLVASGRLVAVGEIAESLSEEIMEPILGMRSHLEGVLRQQSTLEELMGACAGLEDIEELVRERQELVDECLEGVDRIEKILSEVRGFSQGRTGPREEADLNRLAADALRIARVRAGSGVRIREVLAAEARVTCVPDEITQVIVNLLVNAFHAVRETGNVALRSELKNGQVRLIVEDDGEGIASDVIERIFDPFYTTKPVGEGTGLGLAISQHIVRQHGGELRVETGSGQGTSFSLVLPALGRTSGATSLGGEDVQGAVTG
jgi:signal transduction histidine kinase